MFFKDRHQAGEMLADKLSHYRNRHPLLLAVPRGGVIVAEPLWNRVGGELDLIITRKIGAPYQPELAVGAVTGDGFYMLNDQLVFRLNVEEKYIKKAVDKELTEIKRRLKDYRGSRPLPDIDGRLVILIDDGVATGYTLLAALRSLQEKSLSKLVLAVPVGPPDTFSILEHEVDELVYLEAPENFAAVGQFYREFSQVSDNEVKAVLRKTGMKGGREDA